MAMTKPPLPPQQISFREHTNPCDGPALAAVINAAYACDRYKHPKYYDLMSDVVASEHICSV